VLPFDSRIVHSAGSAEVAELGATFALEALAAEERNAYQGHLERCGFCRRLVGQFRAVTDLLPDALEEPATTPGLKERVVAQARAELGAEARQSARPPLEKRRGWITWQWPGWLTPVPTATIGLLLLAVVGLAVWSIELSTKLKAQETALAEQLQLLSAVAAGGGIFSLAGTEAAPDARGLLVQDPAGGKSFLLLKSLPSLPADREYQIWRIKGNQPVGVGSFGLTDRPEQLIILGADFADADAIGVSIEPLGGSLAPTGAIVLLGTF
jgi:anti-sigma-K factor RskA